VLPGGVVEKERDIFGPTVKLRAGDREKTQPVLSEKLMFLSRGQAGRGEHWKHLGRGG